MNLLDINSYVRIFANDATKMKYQDTFFTTLANEAQKDIVMTTNCLKCASPYTFDTVVDQATYTLPDNILKIDYDGGVAYYDGDKTDRLDLVTRQWLDNYESSWRDASHDRPLYYYMNNQVLGLYPKPDTAVTNGIIVYYIVKPTDLANDTDIPFNGNRMLDTYHIAIPYFMLWKIAEIERLEVAPYYQQQYLNEIKKLKQEYMCKIDLNQGLKPYIAPKIW